MAKIIKLLEGLEGKGIKLNTKALANYSAENGVLVNISCSRKRGKVTLPPKLLGLKPEKWDDGTKTFYADHVSMGQLVMIPKEKESKLNQLEMQARRLAASYTLNGTYMPTSMYGEFKEQFEEIRKQYLETIESVAGQWEDIRVEFIEGVQTTVNRLAKRTMMKRDREKMVKEITKAIPTANAYRAAANLTAEVRVFPTTATAEGLEPDMQDLVNQTWRNDVIANVVNSIEISMGELFAKTCQLAKGYQKNQRIDRRALATLQRISLRVRKMNLFANPMLEALAVTLGGLNGDDEDMKIEMTVEDSIVDIWAYARSTDIKLDLDVCPFDEETLENMLKLREDVA